METLFQSVTYTSLQNVLDAIKTACHDDSTFEQFTTTRDQIINSKGNIIAMLQKLTIAKLKEFVYVQRDYKKDGLVRKVYDAFLSSFNVMDGMVSYSPFDGETYETALFKKLNQVTEEDLIRYKATRKAKREALQKAMRNPETLEEFRIFISRHREGEKALNPEQRERYDELMTGRIRQHKDQDADRRSKLTAVSIGETDLLVKETVHTKKKIPLWVVQLSERVERPIYEELNQRAKSLGGYYSSFRGNGAIPGFTFERKEAAELFTQIKDGDVNAAQLRAAINADRAQQRGERVQEKAERMEERATEVLEQDRLTNTARRARIATSAEQQAIAEIQFAKTLHSIGERTVTGTIKYLGRLATIVQLEELYSILSACKWQYIGESGINSDYFEYSSEVINHAQFPYPSLYKDTSLNILLQNLSLDPGKKLAAARMYKRMQAEKGEFFTVRDGKPMEDYNRLFCWSSRGLKAWESIRYRNQYMRYARIQKLDFTTIYELRTALRELVSIDQESEISPEQKKIQAIRELDRKFVTLKIPGFFPTPADLAGQIVGKARIEPGHTILEPSAGLGHMAQAIADTHQDNELLCIEQYSPLVDALRLKDFEVVHTDFLEYKEKSFDRIIMNPPFENLQDIDHVRHAWTLLKPGGRIVAVMANNKSGEREKIKEFSEFVEQYGSMETNELGAFQTAFRPTGVNTITVILDKP